MTSIATLTDVTKRYGSKTAVANLSLSIAKGDVICLLGPNGAGKTTALKMMLGLERPSSGGIDVDGIDVTKDPKRARQRMAYIPEMVALHETFTGMENLQYFAALVGGADLSAGHLEGCLSRAGLQQEAWERRLAGYSKGMRQKVGVAIALAKKASLLVLDEPTSGLDPKSAYDFAALTKDVAAGNAGVVMATHDIFRAKDMATQILILKDGRVVDTIDPASCSYEDIERAYLRVFEAAA